MIYNHCPNMLIHWQEIVGPWAPNLFSFSCVLGACYLEEPCAVFGGPRAFRIYAVFKCSWTVFLVWGCSGCQMGDVAVVHDYGEVNANSDCKQAHKIGRGFLSSPLCCVHSCGIRHMS